jgi:hypothetical protein
VVPLPPMVTVHVPFVQFTMLTVADSAATPAEPLALEKLHVLEVLEQFDKAVSNTSRAPFIRNTMSPPSAEKVVCALDLS